MPTYFTIYGYKIYCWSNEVGEPIHFHISKGKFTKNATKVWVLSNGSLELCHNKGRVPIKDIKRIFAVMTNESFRFVDFWSSHMGYVKFFR